MIVDDEENILKAIKRLINHSKDWHVEAYSNPEQALAKAMEKSFDLYLSDYKMPDIDGVTFLTAVKIFNQIPCESYLAVIQIWMR